MSHGLGTQDSLSRESITVTLGGFQIIRGPGPKLEFEPRGMKVLWRSGLTPDLCTFPIRISLMESDFWAKVRECLSGGIQQLPRQLQEPVDRKSVV